MKELKHFVNHLGKKVLFDNIEMILQKISLDCLECLNGSMTPVPVSASDCRMIFTDKFDIDINEIPYELCAIKTESGKYINAETLFSKSIDKKESEIIRQLCKDSLITKDELLEKRNQRFRKYLWPRQIHMTVRHLVLGYTLEMSAKPYGLDHATVLNSKSKVLTYIETDKQYREKFRKSFETIVTNFPKAYKILNLDYLKENVN